jgi:hypothetical protein
MTDSLPGAPEDGCAGCTLHDRRDFLLDALRAGAAALAAIGLAPVAAEAMPLRWISALATRGAEHTYPVPATDGVQIDKANEVILFACRARPARPLRAIRKDVSRSLERVITRAMAKDPSKRFADAVEMLAALEDVPVLVELAQRTTTHVREEQATTMQIADIDLRPPSLFARAWSWLRFGRWRWT